MNHSSKKPQTNRLFHRLGVLLMIVAVLYFGKPVLVPVALSIMLAFILTPLVYVLEGWKLGRLIGTGRKRFGIRRYWINILGSGRTNSAPGK